MKNGNKTIIREEVERDMVTGEITHQTLLNKVPMEPDYVKIYLDCLGLFSQNLGLDKALNGLLLETLKHMSYAEDGQVIVLNGYVKSQIAKACGKTVARLDQALTVWVNNHVLARIARGTYQANPSLFGKGKWADISKLRATFSFDTGTIVTETTYKTQSEDNQHVPEPIDERKEA